MFLDAELPGPLAALLAVIAIISVITIAASLFGVGQGPRRPRR